MRWKTLFLLLLLAQVAVLAAASDWPKEVEHPKALITIYEPQIENLARNDVQARAAVSVIITGETEPHFGAVWITARLDVDRDERMVYLRDIQVPKVRFPEATDVQKERLADILELEIPKWDIQESLDNLIPLLELAEHDEAEDKGYKNDPPEILTATKQTMLVVIDGEPHLQAVTMPEKSVKKKIERVVNTPNLIAYYPKKKTFYLSGGGKIWFSATDVLGPYTPTNRVPSAVEDMLTEEEKNVEGDDEEPPAVMVVTGPTELIVTDGKPAYAPVADLDLLYVTNTDSSVIVDVALQKHFVLLSGRWYSSEKTLEGPFSFVDPGQLPEDFAKIPTDSDIADVLTHVPGTDQARDAMMDNLIPQTAAIKRDDTSLKVEYDGAPKFEDVEETSIQYAVNSPQSVFKVGSLCYCCNEGVWYVSGSATGPWAVATEVPSEIYDIPPSNPNYNVTYVRVYDVTPTVVYVGYTPGYMGSYAYGGSVVYGTGWYYPGWYGRYYYPRPYTWGFHATFSPFYGWGFGLSWGYGPFRIGIGGWGRYHHHGWWGAGRYRHHHHHHHHYHGGSRHRRASATRPPSSGRPGGVGSAQPRNSNIYSKNQNAGRMAQRPGGSGARPATAAGKSNNLVTDSRGNVYRQGSSGSWDKRSGGSWKSSSAPSGSKTSSQPSARSRGQSRSKSYGSFGGSRGGGGRGGGGGRRR